MPKTKKTEEIALSPTVEYVETLTITDDSSMTAAVVVLSKLNKELARIEQDRDKILDPMKATIKEVKSRYEPKIRELEGAIEYTRTLMTRYQTAQTEIIEHKQKLIADKVGTSLTPEKAMEKIASITGPEERVVTNDGSVSFRAWPMCDVEDITQVPYEFLEADLSAIKKLLPKKVAGIKYWVEQRPINRK